MSGPKLSAGAINRFRRATLVVVVGSVAGFGINFALTPAISRIFNPEMFGFFATLTAVTSIFVGVSTFRLEVFAQRKEEDSEALGILSLALVTSCVWGTAITLVGVVGVILFHVSGWWIAVGPLVTIGSLQLVGTAGLTRTQNYRVLAWSNFVQGASSGIVQIVLGLAGAGVGALLVGFASARVVWIIVLRKGGLSRFGLRGVWRKARRFALVSGGSALINSCTGQLPILLCFFFFGQGSVGLFAMAVRLLVAPLGIVGQAAASANVGEVGRCLRNNDPAAISIVWKGGRDLLCIGILPCAAAAIFGAWIVPVVLGSQWEQAGSIVSWLAVGTLAQFVVAPFSQLLNLTGRSRWMLYWDTLRFLCVSLAFGLTKVFGGSLLLAVGLHSIGLVILYAAMSKMILSAVRRGNG